MNELSQLLLNGLVNGSIIALAGIGLTLVFGILNIINFAHGDYLTFGAFIAFTVNIVLAQNIVLAVIAAVVATALFGLLLEFVVWRPIRMRGAGKITLLIVSIGLALIIRNSILLIWGGEFRRYSVDIYDTHEFGSLNLTSAQIVTISLSFTAVAAVVVLLAYTRLGKRMRALADNPGLAGITGIDTDRIILLTWVIGSALAGLAGVLQGLLQNFFDPNLGLTLLLLIFAAVIVGGIGSAYGCLVGGLALGIAMEISTWSGFAGGLPAVYKPIVAFAILIIALIVRPQGIFGKARII